MTLPAPSKDCERLQCGIVLWQVAKQLSRAEQRVAYDELSSGCIHLVLPAATPATERMLPPAAAAAAAAAHPAAEISAAAGTADTQAADPTNDAAGQPEQLGDSGRAAAPGKAGGEAAAAVSAVASAPPSDAVAASLPPPATAGAIAASKASMQCHTHVRLMAAADPTVCTSTHMGCCCLQARRPARKQPGQMARSACLAASKAAERRRC
jgi:hypothetical protein